MNTYIRTFTDLNHYYTRVQITGEWCPDTLAMKLTGFQGEAPRGELEPIFREEAAAALGVPAASLESHLISLELDEGMAEGQPTLGSTGIVLEPPTLPPEASSWDYEDDDCGGPF